MSSEAHALSPLDDDLPLDIVEDPAEAAAHEIATLEAEAARASGPLAARLVLHAGWLHESRLGDRTAAAACYRRAHELDPDYRAWSEALFRVSSDAGDWATVAALLESEAAAAKDVIGRVEALKTRASVLEEKLGNPDESRAIRLQALALLPQHQGLLGWAIADAETRGEAATELELRARMAQAVKDDRIKARHLARAARLAEAAGDPARALAFRRELLEIAPHDLEAQASIVPLLHRDGEEAAIEKLARAEVEASSGPHARVRLARLLAAREGLVASDLEGVDDAALEILQTAREINPRDGTTLEAMIELSEQRGLPVEAHLKARFDTARDPLEKAWTALRLARLATAGGRADEAKSWDAQVLELCPGHPEATPPAVGPRLTLDEERAAATAGLAKTDVPAEKARWLYVLGAVAEESGAAPEAASRYLDALGFDAGHLGARNALVRLHERAGQWQELSQFYEKEYLFAQEPEQKRQALVDMAEVMELHLDDPTSAAAAYRMALDLGADPLTAASLVRCAQRTNKVRDLVFGYEKLAEGGALSTRQQLLALHRAAETWQHGLKKATEAARAWERIRVLAPDYGPARRALRGLYEAAGATEQLAALEGRTSDDASSALAATAGQARKALLARDWPAAAQALESLAASPDAPPTVWADLARTRLALNEPGAAADALARWSERLKDGFAKADALLRLAEIAEEKQQDTSRARQALETAVQAAPRHVASWKLLARLAFAAGDTARAATALEQEAAVAQLKDRTGARRRLALVAERLGERERAAALLREIYDEDNSDQWAIAELERLATELADRPRALEFRTKLAARCSDMRAAAALRVSVGDDRRLSGDEAGAHNEYRRALALDARLRSVADRVIAVMRASGDRAGLLDMYQRQAPYLPVDSQAAIALMRGDLLLQDGNAPLALKCFRDALAADPLLMPALRAARALHEANGEWNDARMLLAQEGESHVDPAAGVRLVVHAGELAEKVGNTEQAEVHYLRALELRRGQWEALQRLGALYGPTAREAELVALYEREGEAVSAEPVASARLYAEAAWLRFDRLKEERRAAVPLNRALARDPNCVRALELKATIALAEGRPADAEAALTAALAAAPTERPRLLLRLAKARLGAGRAAEALEAAREAAAADPGVEALEIIAESALASGALEVAAGAVDQLVALASEPATAARYAKLGASIRLRGGDVEGASALYRRALTLTPDDAEAVAGLEAAHLGANDPSGLVRAWQTLAQGTADPAQAQGYRLRAAMVWSAIDPAKAVEALKAALQADPANGSVRLALARAYGATQATWPNAAAELRALLSRGPLAAEPYRELLALFDRAKRTDGSFCVLACLVALGAATPEESARYGEAASRLKPASAALSPEDLELLVHPAERGSPVREVLAALSGALLKVIPGNLDAHGLSRNDRVQGDLRAAAAHYSKVFGGPEIELLQSALQPDGVWIENTEPPALVLGSSRVAAPLGESLFTLGQLLGRVRQRNQAAYFAQPAEVANLVAEALRQVDPAFARFGTRNDALGGALGRVLARADRKALELVLPKFATAAVNFEVVTFGMALTSHRFGLATSGDPAASVAALSQGAEPAAFGARADVRELLAFAVSEEHLTIRQKLRTAIG